MAGVGPYGRRKGGVTEKLGRDLRLGPTRGVVESIDLMKKMPTTNIKTESISFEELNHRVCEESHESNKMVNLSRRNQVLISSKGLI